MRVGIRMAAVCMLALALQHAHAADASGDWKGSFDFQGTTVALTFHLKIAGNTLTGTVEGLPTSPATIQDGKANGDALTFDVNTDYQGQTYQLVYQGKLSGDAIDFNFGTPDGSWDAEVLAKRSGEAAPQPDVTGDWSGAFDFQGTSVPLTFHMKSAGSAVTGSIDGLGSSPTEMHDGKVVGDAVTFWVDTDYQGQTYRLDYNGKIAADHIDFSFGTEDGSWGATVTAAKAGPSPATPATAPAPVASPAVAPTTAPAAPPAQSPSSPQK